MDHFTVVCSLTLPLNGSEAGGDLALKETSVFVMLKHLVSITKAVRSVSKQGHL